MFIEKWLEHLDQEADTERCLSLGLSDRIEQSRTGQIELVGHLRRISLAEADTAGMNVQTQRDRRSCFR